jgi:hypothetical protein
MWTEFRCSLPNKGATRLLGAKPRWTDLFFPLWYPALSFALFGVAALKLGCRFTLRWAIIATMVVAGVLGMTLIL